MDDQPKFNLKRLDLTFDGKKTGFLGKLAYQVFRAKVPGGWFVLVSGNDGASGITFYPDPGHLWNGGTLE